MKRRITLDQINELDEVQKEKLRNWWVPEDGDYYVYSLEGTNYQDMVRAIKGFLFENNGLKIYKEHKLPLLDISQMIHILSDILSSNKDCNVYEISMVYSNRNNWECDIETYNLTNTEYVFGEMDINVQRGRNKNKINKANKDLCDTLWEMLKGLL